MKFQVSTPSKYVEVDSDENFEVVFAVHLPFRTRPDSILIDTSDSLEPRIDFFDGERRFARWDGECAIKLRGELGKIEPRILALKPMSA